MQSAMGSIPYGNIDFSNSPINFLYGVYTIQNENKFNVSLRKLAYDFSAIGNANNISNEKCTSWQYSPLVRFNQYGNSIVVWTDERDGNGNVYCQVFDVNNNPISGNIQVSDLGEKLYKPSSFLLVDNEGNFLVPYMVSSGMVSLFLKKISKEGIKDDTRQKIFEIATMYHRYSLHSIQSGEYFLFTISSDRKILSLKKFDKSFNASGSDVNLFIAKNNYVLPDLNYSLNERKEIFLTWAENTQLKGIVLNEFGKTVKDTFQISKLSSNSYHSSFSLGLDKENNIVVAWIERQIVGGKPNYYLNCWRKYSNDDQLMNFFPLPVNFSSAGIYKFFNKKVVLIANSSFGVKGIYLNDNDQTIIPVSIHNFNDAHQNPYLGNNPFSLDIYKDKLKFCYESTEEPKFGLDIRQNILALDDFDLTSVRVDQPSENTNEPISISVTNPIISRGVIRYQIKREQKVNISLYNILGERVKEIINTIHTEGIYQTNLELGDLVSGVYFIRVEGQINLAKKILFIK